MTASAWLLASYAVVYAVNLAPGFMPPTWAILAFFLVRYDLPLLPLALGGAAAASAGRLTLALASRWWGRSLLSATRREKLARLGIWLDTRARWAAPAAVLLYSFGPIPSNQLFIAAGLTGMRLTPIVAAFLAGRIVSYTLWVTVARHAVGRLEEVFLGHWGNVGALAAQVVAFGALAVIVRIDWPRLLRLPVTDTEPRGQSSEPPPAPRSSARPRGDSSQ